MLALLAGCGGDGGAGKLPKPLFASCGVEQLGKPRATRATKKGEAIDVWLVNYLADPKKRLKFGQTTNLSIVERAPEGPQGRLKGGKEKVIAGRRVSFLGSSHTGYSAQWKTGKAKYVALANGASPRTLYKVIECMP